MTSPAMRITLAILTAAGGLTFAASQASAGGDAANRTGTHTNQVAAAPAAENPRSGRAVDSLDLRLSRRAMDYTRPSAQPFHLGDGARLRAGAGERRHTYVRWQLDVPLYEVR